MKVPVENIIPADKVKDQLDRMLDKLDEENPYVITRGSGAIAALVPISLLNKLGSPVSEIGPTSAPPKPAWMPSTPPPPIKPASPTPSPMPPPIPRPPVPPPPIPPISKVGPLVTENEVSKLVNQPAITTPSQPAPVSPPSPTGTNQSGSDQNKPVASPFANLSTAAINSKPTGVAMNPGFPMNASQDHGSPTDDKPDESDDEDIL